MAQVEGARSPLERIMAEVAQFSKTMGGIHADYLKTVLRDLNRYLEESNNLSSQMKWNGYTTLALTGISASLAVAGACIPKTNGATPNLDPRGTANAGSAEMFAQINKLLSDNEFLRTSCKTSAKFFKGVAPAADAFHRSGQTKTESLRNMIQQYMQSGQQGKSNCDTQIQQAMTAILRILDSKSKGG